MIAKQATYRISSDMLQKVLNVLYEFSSFPDGDGDEYDDESVMGAIRLIEDEIKKQDHMAEAAGVI